MRKLQTLFVRLLFTFILLLWVSNIFAQSDKEKRADQLFDGFAYIDAIKMNEDIARSGGVNNHVCKQLAEAYRRIGNSEQCEYWYRMLIDMGTTDAIDYYYYAEALKSNKKYKEAEKWVKKFADLQPTDSRMKRQLDAQKGINVFIADSNTVEIIKLNSINSKYSDFSPSYYNDNKITFASAREIENNSKTKYVWDEQPFIDIYIADKMASMQLVNPKPLSKEVNSPYHEGPMTFNETGNIMYFTRNNMIESRKLIKSKDKTTNLKIYSAQLIGGEWGNIKELKYNSDEYSTGHPTLTLDGNLLYFASDRPGGYGQADIYVCKRLEGEWSEPENLGPTINTEGNEMFPFIHSDGTLYFSSDGLVGFGGLDVYAATRKADSTFQIVNMGYPMNSPKDDFGLIMDDLSMSGYFSSNRKGGEGFDDIYAFKVTDPNLLLSQLNKEKMEKAKEAKKKIEEENKRVADKLKEDNALVFDGKKIQVGETILLPNIYYDFDKYFIRDDAKIELNKVIEFMVRYPTAVIELSSHTDCRGTFEYNMNLSQNRAKSAIEYISKFGGISIDRMIPRGYGETKMVNNCADGMPCSEADHQMNRRTDFTLLRK